MWKYECDDDTMLDANQLREASKWYVNRFEEFIDGNTVEELYFNEDHVYIEWSWDRYCMGCHMETHREIYKIPNNIFFSDKPAREWKEEEHEKQKIKDEKEKKKRIEKEKKEKAQRKEENRIKREKKEKAQRKEENRIKREKKDKDDYERLKVKFEGKG